MEKIKRLQDLVSEEELIMTKEVLKIVKRTYSNEEFCLAKKMIMLVSIMGGKEGFITYHQFIEYAIKEMKIGIPPSHWFGFCYRAMNDKFFGEYISIIRLGTIETIRINALKRTHI